MAADVVALTAQGRLRGARDGPALRFLGIPFAESPVTAGRFGAPAAPGRWDGIRDALSYGATSPQPDRGVTLIPEPIIAGDNELNLNVFTPDLNPVRLPVLVWIHGGGFFAGCNASPWYRGGPFARDGVVLVSVNYRLGAEGFLEVPGAPANRAVRDWVRALEWVQENIAAFGGDPGRVTIAGQSAGGAACAALLGVPAARGLFRGAACVSGGSGRPGSARNAGGGHARRAGPLRHRRCPRLGAARSGPQAGHGVRRAIRGAGRSARGGAQGLDVAVPEAGRWRSGTGLRSRRHRQPPRSGCAGPAGTS
jgi:para-nitrobenzyl esterase